MGNKSSVSFEKDDSKASIAEESVIMDIFGSYLQNPNMDRKTFHEAMFALEKLGLRRLRGTPLADGLFNIFDTEKSGLVSKVDFVKSCTVIIGKDQNKKLTLSFRAYSKNENKILARNFLDTLIKTWQKAFSFLAEELSQKAEEEFDEIITTLNFHSTRHLSKFREAVFQSLIPYLTHKNGNKMSKNTPIDKLDNDYYLDLSSFVAWASRDRTLRLNYSGTAIFVACTLLFIETPPIIAGG